MRADLGELRKLFRQIPSLVFSFFKKEWLVLNEHPAQSSISWDVIMTSLSAVAFMIHDNVTQTEADLKVPYELVLLLTMVTPLVGVQSSIGMYLAIREGKRETMQQQMKWDKEEEKEKKKE